MRSEHEDDPGPQRPDDLHRREWAAGRGADRRPTRATLMLVADASAQLLRRASGPIVAVVAHAKVKVMRR
jgi:hypothetical protein